MCLLTTFAQLACRVCSKYRALNSPRNYETLRDCIDALANFKELLSDRTSQ